MKMPNYVLISKMTGSPEIRITVQAEGLGIEMDLQEFIKVLAKEAKNPTLIFTGTQLEKRLLSAAEAVVKAMKKETARVM